MGSNPILKCHLCDYPCNQHQEKNSLQESRLKHPQNWKGNKEKENTIGKFIILVIIAKLYKFVTYQSQMKDVNNTRNHSFSRDVSHKWGFIIYMLVQSGNLELLLPALAVSRITIMNYVVSRCLEIKVCPGLPGPSGQS